MQIEHLQVVQNLLLVLIGHKKLADLYRLKLLGLVPAAISSARALAAPSNSDDGTTRSTRPSFRAAASLQESESLYTFLQASAIERECAPAIEFWDFIPCNMCVQLLFGFPWSDM